MSLLDDAVELVCWFESLPDCGTYHSDERIAARLGWFNGGASLGPITSARRRVGGGSLPSGDAARVRRARRYVDQNNGQQPFLGYSFGTKRNGSGVKFMMLITPKMRNSGEAADEAASEQMGRAVQQASQATSERARMIHKLNEQESAYIKDSKFDRALVLHDAAKELQTTGQITMSTLRAARELGILREVGGHL
jgi:hypothetical protein